MPKPRARDLGIPFEGKPGKKNGITDAGGIKNYPTKYFIGGVCGSLAAGRS